MTEPASWYARALEAAAESCGNKIAFLESALDGARDATYRSNLLVRIEDAKQFRDTIRALPIPADEPTKAAGARAMKTAVLTTLLRLTNPNPVHSDAGIAWNRAMDAASQTVRSISPEYALRRRRTT